MYQIDRRLHFCLERIIHSLRLKIWCKWPLKRNWIEKKEKSTMEKNRAKVFFIFSYYKLWVWHFYRYETVISRNLLYMSEWNIWKSWNFCVLEILLCTLIYKSMRIKFWRIVNQTEYHEYIHYFRTIILKNELWLWLWQQSKEKMNVSEVKVSFFFAKLG